MLTQRVHQCEFCGASFHPRAQVKNPRACSHKVCQRKRQRSNELAWRDAHSTRSDPEYHRLRKASRLTYLTQILECIVRCLETGATFLHEKISVTLLRELLLQFLIALGVRRVNKLWPDNIVPSERGVAALPF